MTELEICQGLYRDLTEENMAKDAEIKRLEGLAALADELVANAKVLIDSLKTPFDFMTAASLAQLNADVEAYQSARGKS